MLDCRPQEKRGRGRKDSIWGEGKEDLRRRKKNFCREKEEGDMPQKPCEEGKLRRWRTENSRLRAKSPEEKRAVVGQGKEPKGCTFWKKTWAVRKRGPVGACVEKEKRKGGPLKGGLVLCQEGVLKGTLKNDVTGKKTKNLGAGG